MRTSAEQNDRGFVAIEITNSIAVLFVPIVMIVAAIPTWIERRHAATISAREAANYAAESFPASVRDADDVAAVVASNYGIAPDEMLVRVRTDDTRGGQVTARVTIEMPAIVVPFVGPVGRWSDTVEYSIRIDDYRSRS